MFQSQPDGKEHQFHLGRRSPDTLPLHSALEQQLLDRQAIVLDETVAGDDLEIGMHMHQFGPGHVERERMEHPGVPYPGARLRELEAVSEQHAFELPGVPEIDKQIDVIRPLEGLCQPYIAFPVAIPDALSVQVVDQRLDAVI